MYKVRDNKWILFLVSILIFFILAIVVLVFLGIDGDSKTWRICLYICVPIILIYIIGIADFFHSKIIVSDSKLIVKRLFVKTKEYYFENIKYYFFGRNSIYVYMNNNRTFSASGYQTNYDNFVEKIQQVAKLKKPISCPLVLNQDKALDASFTIKQKKISLILYSFFVLFIAALVFLVTLFDPKEELIGFTAMTCSILFFAILTTLCIIETLRLKIQINGLNMTITPIIGKKRHCSLNNITNIVGISSGAKIYFSDGKCFKLHYTFKTNIDLFIDLFTED